MDMPLKHGYAQQKKQRRIRQRFYAARCLTKLFYQINDIKVNFKNKVLKKRQSDSSCTIVILYKKHIKFFCGNSKKYLFLTEALQFADTGIAGKKRTEYNGSST